MSALAMGRIWDLELPHNQMLVLLAMADHADHAGRNIFPGLPLIAHKTGYSQVEVRRIVKKLVESGLLVEEGALPGKPKKYRIDFSKGIQKPEFKSKKSKNPSQNDMGLNPSQNDTPIMPSEERDEPTPIIPSLKKDDEPSFKNEPSNVVVLKDNNSLERPTIYSVYESKFGLLTASIGQQLIDFETEYGCERVGKAIEVTAERRKTKPIKDPLAYIQGVLRNLRVEEGAKVSEKSKPAQKPVEPELTPDEQEAKRIREEEMLDHAAAFLQKSKPQARAS